MFFVRLGQIKRPSDVIVWWMSRETGILSRYASVMSEHFQRNTLKYMFVKRTWRQYEALPLQLGHYIMTRSTFWHIIVQYGESA